MYNLKSTIATLPRIIGCEDFPKSPQGQLLIEDLNDFVNRQYNFDGKAVIEAFNLAATYELYLDNKRVDPSTFGKHLSRASVGKVLTAYKERKRNETARPQYLGLPAPEKKSILPSGAHDLILKWCKEDGKLPDFAPYITAYRYLLDNDLVSKPTTTKSGSRTSTMFNQSLRINISPKRQVAEDWYTHNVLK